MTQSTTQHVPPAKAGYSFNTPPGWPPTPAGWSPAPGWVPDPAWPPAPHGWVWYTPVYAATSFSSAPAPTRPWIARHKILTGLAGFVALIIAIAIGTSGGGADSKSTPAATPTTSGTADQPQADQPKADQPKAKSDSGTAIGQPVRDGKFEFTVTKVEPGVAEIGTAPLNQVAQGQFVLVHVTVANIGKEAQMFDGGSQIAYDATGTKFSADGGAAIYLDNSNSFLNDINPGNSVDGIIVFDVPKTVTLTSLEMHDSMFSGGEKVKIG